MPNSRRPDGDRENEPGVNIPNWFVRIATAAISIIITVALGAIPWAWSINSSVTKIEVQIDGLDRIWTQEMIEVKRRIEVLERNGK